MQLRQDDYPSNADNLLMFNFKRDKVQAYQAMQDLINMGVLIFPKSLNSRYELEFEETTVDGDPTIRYEKVDNVSMDALIQIDLMKEEICGFTKVTKPNGTVQFETSADAKSKGVQDNRADAACQIAFILMQLRAAEALDKERPGSDFGKMFSSVNHKPKGKDTRDRFGVRTNPFVNPKNYNPFN